MYWIAQTAVTGVLLIVSALVKLPVAPFIIIAFALTVIQWIISSMSRYALLRVIPMPHTSVGNIQLMISTILRTLIMISLTIAYVSIDKFESVVFYYEVLQVLQVLLLYRALNKLYHCPLTASIESLILLYVPDMWLLWMASFMLNRALILYRKSTYILVSIMTAMKNKK